MPDPAPGERTGRRPGRPDTRQAVLDAARAQFAAHGFRGATVRAVAAAAGVDPALVHHYFGSKQKLFLAATLADRRPSDVLHGLSEVSPERVGEHAASFVLGLWEGVGEDRIAALLRTAATDPRAADILKEVIVEQAVVPMLTRTGVPAEEVPHRAALMAATMIGLAMGRHVLHLPGLVDLPTSTLVAEYGPVLQHFVTGDLNLFSR